MVNLFTTPLLELREKFGKLEGEKWFDESLRFHQCSAYGLHHAIDWARKAQAAAARGADEFRREVGWAAAYEDNLTNYGIIEVYGHGGWHRYPVNARGDVKFSKHHAAQPEDIKKAEELGFDLG